MSRLILYLLGLYKRWLSPLFGARCRYHPSCSDYARVAVARHGAARGSLLAAWRLLRCNPASRGGFDYVPERFTFRRQRSAPPRSED
ncbi:membrane protein insertion efficiency factor YidD [Tahibacter sp. P2K]|uniref:Putative membrane protein insertion efficiency factor n=1 Tax=Tahibacter harae TaxID=2963937 RepID=A0ABT1QNP6_9GAMM|nr:membrane protein insertion efficiency factor YidD [Tahibacter harae]